jgi:indole-3-glycerol phosphate synthase
MKIRRRPPSSSVNVGPLEYQIVVPEGKPEHILEEIVWDKEREVPVLRDKMPLDKLKKQVSAMAPPLDFLGALKSGKTHPAVIAEVKKASPCRDCQILSARWCQLFVSFDRSNLLSG